MKRALIVDGFELFRISLRDILSGSGQFDAISEAATSSEFIRESADDSPISLVVIHPRSIGLSEDDCLKLVRRLMGDVQVVMFRDSSQPTTISEAEANVTILPRAAQSSDVIEAIGGRPGAALAKSSEIKADHKALPKAMHNLSRRQRQIMAMVAEGLANKEIAHRLGIAEGTVKAHIHAVFRALGVTNRTQAVVRYGPALRAASL